MQATALRGKHSATFYKSLLSYQSSMPVALQVMQQVPGNMYNADSNRTDITEINLLAGLFFEITILKQHVSITTAGCFS